MRTTIRLSEPLLAEAKKLAVETKRTLTSVIEDALREVLARRRQSRLIGPNRKFKFTTVGGKGPRPGVDLDHSAALLELMESPDDPR